MPVNTVTIVGHLTRDPELKTLQSGTSVCDLGVAVNERVKSGDQWEDRASFFDVTAYGGQAEAIAKFLSKGRQVAIAGRLRQERWQNQQGENRSRVKIIASEVQFVGGRPDGQGQQQGHGNGQGAWGGQQSSGFGHAQTQTPVSGAQGDFDWGHAPKVQTGPANDPDDIPF